MRLWQRITAPFEFLQRPKTAKQATAEVSYIPEQDRPRQRRERLINSDSWMILLFLLLGVAIGAVGSFFGTPPGEVENGGRLAEYHGLNPADRAVITDYVSSAGYTYLTLLTRTAAPENGLATVTIYGSNGGAQDSEVKRLESTNASWSRFGQTISYSRVRAKVEGPLPGNGTPATQVDIVIYLSQHAPGSGCPLFSLCSLARFTG